MKIKKRLTGLFIAAMLLFNSSVMASATTFGGENAEKNQNDNVQSENFSDSESGFSFETIEPVDLTGIDPSSIIEVPLTENYSDLPTEESIERDFDIPELTIDDAQNAISLDEELAKSNAKASYQLSTISDVLEAGQNYKLYSVTNLQKDNILQVELQVPRNSSLNYNLYVFEYYPEEGKIVAVSASEYATTSEFIAESACVVNREGKTTSYLVMVDSGNNPSTTDYYTLSVSAGGTYESFEPNDSAFYATEFPNIPSNQVLKLTASLNTPIDNDWFEYYFTDLSSYAGLEITGVPEGMVVESYYVTNSNQMHKTGSTKDDPVLPLQKGYNYFRVRSTREGAFQPKTYTIRFTPALHVEKIVTVIAVDGYCQRTSSLFNDHKTRFLFTNRANVQVRVQYMTKNNIPVNTNDTVKVNVLNPNWQNDSLRNWGDETTIRNNSECSVFFEAGTTTMMDRVNFVYTTIRSSNYGTIADGVEMALIDKYDDGETSRPCRHNGTCGFK